MNKRRLMREMMMMGGELFVKMFTTTTTSSPQTVTFIRLTPTGNDIKVRWGDGGTDTTVANGEAGVVAHAYAAAGTYTISMTRPTSITYLQIGDATLSCAAGTIGSLKELTALALWGSAAGIIIGAGEIGGLTALTYLALLAPATMAPGEYATLINLAAVLYWFGGSTADVDAILATIYAARMSYTYATPTLDISVTNQTPSGIYQDAAPPTTGLEYKFKLQTDPDTEGFNKWAITNA